MLPLWSREHARGVGDFRLSSDAASKAGLTKSGSKLPHSKAAVSILGTNLTGASGVTFNGTPATFTVVSGSLITTTVPAGATSGKVQVTTPARTLSSNVAFRVIP